LENRVLENRVLENRVLENRVLENRVLESRVLESRVEWQHQLAAYPLFQGIRFEGTTFQLCISQPK
jgi:hypothetical protein